MDKKNILPRTIVSNEKLDAEIINYCKENGATYDEVDTIFKYIKKNITNDITREVVLKRCNSIKEQIKYSLTPEQKDIKRREVAEKYFDMAQKELDEYNDLLETHRNSYFLDIDEIRKRRLIFDMVDKSLSRYSEIFGIKDGNKSGKFASLTKNEVNISFLKDSPKDALDLMRGVIDLADIENEQ
jgi:hypothetical protein